MGHASGFLLLILSPLEKLKWQMFACLATPAECAWVCVLDTPKQTCQAWFYIGDRSLREARAMQNAVSYTAKAVPRAQWQWRQHPLSCVRGVTDTVLAARAVMLLIRKPLE